MIACTLDDREDGMRRFVRGMSAAAVLFGAAACTRISGGVPVAAPDAFPDLANYPVVENVYGTENTRQYFSGDTFTTPDGQRCSVNVRDYLHRLWCSGPRPDRGGYWDTSFGPNTPATIKPADPPAADWKPRPGEFLPLPPAHKINLPAGMVCGVGPDPAAGMFACRAGEHGFVFTRTATRLF